MPLSRRSLLIGATAGGGLLVAYALRPGPSTPPLAPAPGEIAFNPWIAVARDGLVTVAVPQCEMGQGITTLIPQIVAVELGADWRRIAVEPAAPGPAFANAPLAGRWAPLWAGVFAPLADEPDDAMARPYAERQALMVTADGTALAAYEAPARAAAAAVRSLLAQAAAARWGVRWEECEVRGGFIVHGARRLGFGALAGDALRYDPPDPPVLRAQPARERPVSAIHGDAFGTAPPAFPRLDAPTKVDGSFPLAADVRVPGLVYAAIAHGPIGDSKLEGFAQPSSAPAIGLVGIVRTRRWLAAVATSWWAADRALAALRPRFRVAAAPDSTAIEATLERSLRHGEASRAFSRGDADAAIGGRPTLSVRYDVAPALHATLETSTATARFTGDRLELWLASQAPEQARRAAARALGLATRDVVVYPLAAGGSFDRRLEHEVGIEAATIAREIGRPVQLIYSRRQEHLRGWPRAPAAAVLTARTVAGGGIAAWRTRIAAPSSAREFGARLLDRATPLEALASQSADDDPLVLEGAVPPYAIPNLTVERVAVATRLPTGRLRGNAHGYTAFFTESFVDELARAARREPLSYRIEMLGRDVRLAGCLSAVARLAGWGGGGEGLGEGLACHRIDDVAAPERGGGRIAVIASARREGGAIRVARLVAVVDIGRIVNLDIARQQIEGGLLFGLGLATGSSTAYARGMPATTRLAALNLPRLADCPEIAVGFVDSGAPPFDPGELGVAAVAPAIANALFSDTGVRLRRLPLTA